MGKRNSFVDSLERILLQGVILKERELRIFNIFKNRNGFTLIEALVAMVILIFPIMATLGAVVNLYRQSHRRQLELLAENLATYILEDLRGRTFYLTEDATEKDNLEYLYNSLPQSKDVIDPWNGGTRQTKYSSITDSVYDTAIYNPNDPSYEFPYVDFNFSSLGSYETVAKFYKDFKVEIYLTRYVADETPGPEDDPFKFLYKADIKIYIRDPKVSGGWRQFKTASTEITYHDP